MIDVLLILLHKIHFRQDKDINFILLTTYNIILSILNLLINVI